jgi:hypothetical protein
MGQILENLQALLDYGMALLVLDMGDKANATRIVLIGGVIQTLVLRKGHPGFPQQKQSATQKAERRLHG